MRRALLLAVLMMAAVVFAAAARAGSDPTVTITLRTDAVSPVELADALPAFQHAVTVDFAPYWHSDALLTTSATPGAWRVTVSDDSPLCDPFGGCTLGYHDVRHGVPYAVVYAGTALSVGVPWQKVLTHELFEMLADPYADRAVVEKKQVRIVEVCDPVVDWSFPLPSATGKPIVISDFVTPSWFEPGARGPFDIARRLSGPRQFGDDGYISVWDQGLGWETIFG